MKELQYRQCGDMCYTHTMQALRFRLYCALTQAHQTGGPVSRVAACVLAGILHFIGVNPPLPAPRPPSLAAAAGSALLCVATLLVFGVVLGTTLGQLQPALILLGQLPSAALISLAISVVASYFYIIGRPALIAFSAHLTTLHQQDSR